MSDPRAAGDGTLPPWREVLTTALVGTGRASGGGRGGPGSRGAAGDLLDVAAALTGYRRAGVLPARVAQPPAPPVGVARSETPLVSAAAAARADELLRHDGRVSSAETRGELLGEWLDLVASSGRRVPGELVPALLDAASRRGALRPLLARAAGPVAAWLADQRAEWRYFLPYTDVIPQRDPDLTDESPWGYGDVKRRVEYLAARRGGDPEGASRLLAAGWADETPEDRAALLPALAVGLAPSDEPFLERVLDDRRKEVRWAAADLLSGIDGSGYRRRMTERALSFVDPAPGASAPITVTPPDRCDRSMLRDGITRRPPAGVGERAWWLEEILARTPLATWPGPPAAFLRRPVTSGWRDVLHRGLARATARERDPAWAAALVSALTERVEASGRPDDRLLLEAVYESLPPELLAARAVELLAMGVSRAARLGIEQVLELSPHPWPSEVRDAFLGALMTATAVATREAGWRVTGLCELAGPRLDPGTIGQEPGASAIERVRALAERLAVERPTSSGTAAVQRLAIMLRYRATMREELL